MFSKVWKYFTPYYTAEVSGPLSIMSVAATWHQLRVGPSDMYFATKASFNDNMVIGLRD